MSLCSSSLPALQLKASSWEYSQRLTAQLQQETAVQPTQVEALPAAACWTLIS